MTIQYIALSKLVPSPANVRKTDRGAGLEQLAASIEAHGLLQNLQVKPASKGRFEVAAGERRLAALSLLAKRKKIEADWPVPCNVLNGENLSEISLAENENRRAAAAMRAALTEAHSPADSRMARFVTVKAFEKAGGTVLRDLFSDANAGWLTDTALLNRLVSEKLEREAEAVRAEGWKWVEIVPQLTWETTQGFGAVEPVLSAKQQAEADKLAAKIEAMAGDEEDYDDLCERFDALQDNGHFTDEAKAKAGAMIGIGDDGSADIRRGLIRPEDTKKEKARKTEADGEDAPRPCFSAKLAEDLTAHRTAALQAMLAGNPKVALVAVVHALALGVFYHDDASSLQIAPRIVYLDRSAEGIAEAAAHKELEAATKAIRKRLPKDAAKLWPWLIEQDQKNQLAVLAIAAAYRRCRGASPRRT
jgi:ParB family chromosome partitioning protein